MQGNNNDELLKKALKEKLDWYTMDATEDEYNEEDVEHILSLLDSLDPLEEGEMPPVEEAWGRFCRMSENPRELLPLEKEVPMEKEVPLGTGDSVSTKRDAMASCKTGGPVSVGSGEADADKNNPGSHENPSAPNNKGKGKIIKFVLRHKAIVAAIFLVMVLAVGGSIQAGAIKNSGFFFWLNRDETGTDMFTSPETLDGETSITKDGFYSDRNDMPEWVQGWLEVEAEFVVPENYKWQYYEIKEMDFVRNVISHYFNEGLKQEMLVGVYFYPEGILYNREGFPNYKYVDSYEVEYGNMDVYCKTEETGEISYAICFYEGNCEYYVIMQDDLDEVKTITEQYWGCVKKL